jgi:hypothetical protein
MEVSLKSILSERESWEKEGLQSHIRYIIGDDYDLIPCEILDEEDLFLLSPTDFQQTITA